MERSQTGFLGQRIPRWAQSPPASMPHLQQRGAPASDTDALQPFQFSVFSGCLRRQFLL